MTSLFRNSSPGALTREQAVGLLKKKFAERQRQAQQARELAAQGRGEDTEIAHVARGELVVPWALQNPEVIAVLQRTAAAHGIPFEMLSVGSAMNRINPNTGAPEFWFEGMRDRISNFFENDDVNDGQAITEGIAARGAYDDIKKDLIRGEYDERVRQLGPFDNAQRAQYKPYFREQMPPEMGVFVEKKPTGPREGSFGQANVPNPKATEAARMLGRAGRGLGVVGAGLAAADIATAEDPYRAAFANLGALGGGVLGGFAGGAAGALTGPGAVVAAPAGALAVSALGGDLGYRGGEKLYDFGYDQYRRW